jgi:hypothetical protein
VSADAECDASLPQLRLAHAATAHVLGSPGRDVFFNGGEGTLGCHRGRDRDAALSLESEDLGKTANHDGAGLKKTRRNRRICDPFARSIRGSPQRRPRKSDSRDQTRHCTISANHTRAAKKIRGSF